MMPANLSRWIRHLTGEPNAHSSANPFAQLAATYQSALLLVRAFYTVNLFLIFSMLITFWISWRNMDLHVDLWPLLWVNPIGFSAGVDIAMWAVLIASIGAAIYPGQGFIRILVFVTVFELIAFTNAFGKINHGWHQWVYVTFILMFLPSGTWRSPHSRHEKMAFLTVIWAVQAAILLMYTMSGAWKIYAGIYQFSQQQIHAFHPNALAYLVAERLLQTNSESILGPTIVRFPLVGWPLHILTIYIETVSIVVAFRPSLHRIWGLALSLFHIGIFLAMSIPFNFNLFMLGIFLVLSPFHPSTLNVLHVIRSLPLVGDLLRFGAWLLSRWYPTADGVTPVSS